MHLPPRLADVETSATTFYQFLIQAVRVRDKKTKICSLYGLVALLDGVDVTLAHFFTAEPAELAEPVLAEFEA